MGSKLRKLKEKNPDYDSSGVKDKINQWRQEQRGGTLGYTKKGVVNAMRFLGSKKQQKKQIWDKKRDQQCQVCGILPNKYGFYDYSKIDYTNPIVELEYFLSDPRNRHAVSATRDLEERKNYLEYHLSPEAVELYWHPEAGAKWDKSGTPYKPPTIPYYELTFDKAEVVGDAREALGLKREGFGNRPKKDKQERSE